MDKKEIWEELGYSCEAEYLKAIDKARTEYEADLYRYCCSLYSSRY